MGIESAFLAHDRIDDTRLDRGSDLLVARHAEVGKRVAFERKAAAEHGLADEQRRARVVVANGDVGKRRQRTGIGRLAAEIGRHGGDEIALVDGVENLERTGDFQRAVLGRRARQRARRDFVEAQPGARQLAVIGGRIMRRRFVEGARILLSPQRFGGAALPVKRARQRDRIGDAVGNPGEMRKRDGRLAQKTQRDPAGGKLLLGAVVFVIGRRRAVGDLIGQSGVAEIEKFSRHQPPFHPPLVDIDQVGPDRAARR